MKTQNKFYRNILGGLFLASMMGMTTACDPLGIEPTTKVDEERFWQNPSRRESWTPEMKQQAAMYAGKRYNHE